MTGDELREIGDKSGTHLSMHVSVVPELANALDDRDRLEWLQNAIGIEVDVNVKGVSVYYGETLSSRKTLRDAIDAARSMIHG